MNSTHHPGWIHRSAAQAAQLFVRRARVLKGKSKPGISAACQKGRHASCFKLNCECGNCAHGFIPKIAQ